MTTYQVALSDAQVKVFERAFKGKAAAEDRERAAQEEHALASRNVDTIRDHCREVTALIFESLEVPPGARAHFVDSGLGRPVLEINTDEGGLDGVGAGPAETTGVALQAPDQARDQAPV